MITRGPSGGPAISTVKRPAAVVTSPVTMPFPDDAGPAALLREPAVPKVEPRRGAEVPPQVTAGDVEGKVISELDASNFLIKHGLDTIDDGLSLLRIHLDLQLAEEALLLLVAPPALEGAAQGDVVGGIRGEDEARREDLPELGLLRAVIEGGPVDNLQVHGEPHFFELLLGHERVLIHELVLARRDPPQGLPRVPRFLDEAPSFVLVMLVVELSGCGGVPGLLREEQPGIEAIEVPGAEAAREDRLHVEGGLDRLPQLLLRHRARLVVQHGDGPATWLDDARLERGQAPDALVGVLFDEHRMVVLARLDPREPHGRVRHGEEE